MACRGLSVAAHGVREQRRTVSQHVSDQLVAARKADGRVRRRLEERTDAEPSRSKAGGAGPFFPSSVCAHGRTCKLDSLTLLRDCRCLAKPVRISRNEDCVHSAQAVCSTWPHEPHVHVRLSLCRGRLSPGVTLRGGSTEADQS